MILCAKLAVLRYFEEHDVLSFQRRLGLSKLAAQGLLVTALMGAAYNAYAIDFKSVGSAPAILYDAPSDKGRKTFVAPRGMPVEVVLSYGDWTKVRDAGGDLSWVESKLLTPKRTVVITAANSKVHAAADETSPLVFTADRGVVLELSEPIASGWLKVHHHDGVAGFVKATEAWGD
jgi:SH3-like domain-containing protein